MIVIYRWAKPNVVSSGGLEIRSFRPNLTDSYLYYREALEQKRHNRKQHEDQYENPCYLYRDARETACADNCSEHGEEETNECPVKKVTPAELKR